MDPLDDLFGLQSDPQFGREIAFFPSQLVNPPGDGKHLSSVDHRPSFEYCGANERHRICRTNCLRKHA